MKQSSSRIAIALGALLVGGLSVFNLAGCAPPEEPPPVPAGAPRLVLFIVVDQLRADYLERFRPLLTGGFDRLLTDGVVFTDAHQQHSVTATAPGHATLSTGAFPSSHGVIGNEWYDRERHEDVYCLFDEKDGKSPRPLLRPTLGDRLKATWPDAKVFAVGGKDRSAVLTAGHAANAAFWYDPLTGGVSTTPYYRDAPTATTPWLGTYLESGVLDRLFGTLWQPLVSESQWGVFGVEPLDRGPFTRRFPYSLGGLSAYPDKAFYRSLYSTPFVDVATIELAKALLVGEGLGADEVPDFLGVTLSGLDAVGHSFGPDAPETLDTLIRVDRLLDDLLAFVDAEIGLGQVVVSLSADHGVGQVPEVAEARGIEAGRIEAAGIQCIQRVGQSLTERFSLQDLNWMPSFLYLDRMLIESAGADADQVATALAKELRLCPRVAKVFLPADIVRVLDPPLDELYVNGYYAPRSPDLLLLLQPDTLFGSTVASHGQAYPYDTHVPWLLLAPDQRNGAVVQRVRTVDVAPTLAHYVGVQMAEADGDDLTSLLP